MIKATTQRLDGAPVLIMGLSNENLRRLREGQPVAFPAESIGLPPMDIVIYYAPTEEQAEALLCEMFGKPPRRRVGPDGEGG